MNLCTETDVIKEVLILAKLSHPCLPKLHELFIMDASVFTVSQLTLFNQWLNNDLLGV